MKRNIYESDTLRVYFVPSSEQAPSQQVVIGFRSMIDTKADITSGEAENTIKRAGLDAVHVIPKSNQWYQYPDLRELLEQIRGLTAGYAERMTYGLSMGGFAALHASKALRATRSVTYAPQFSVDQRVITELEPSWVTSVAQTEFIWDHPEDISQNCHHIVIYDPLCRDAQHVNRYRQHVAIDAFRVPFGGHHVWRIFGKAGIGDQALIGLLKGTADRRQLRQKLRQARRGYWGYHLNRGEVLEDLASCRVAVEMDVISVIANARGPLASLVTQAVPDVRARASKAIEALTAAGDARGASMAQRWLGMFQSSMA